MLLQTRRISSHFFLLMISLSQNRRETSCHNIFQNKLHFLLCVFLHMWYDKTNDGIYSFVHQNQIRPLKQGDLSMSVIFVGNGINRCAGIVPGWDELFAEAVNVPSFQVKRSLTPTLEYEQNVQAILNIVPAKKSGDIKRDIAN